jgi:hypothetical protein
MFIDLRSTVLKMSDYYALREEYPNEDESYFRYMLTNSLKEAENSDGKKSA